MGRPDQAREWFQKMSSAAPQRLPNLGSWALEELERLRILAREQARALCRRQLARQGEGITKRIAGEIAVDGHVALPIVAIDLRRPAFHRQLVLSDLSSEYENEIRIWIGELKELDDQEEAETRSHIEP